MPGPSATLQTRMAQHYANQVANLSLHGADPGATGANEIVGVSRKAAVWTINGTQADAALVTFTVTAGTQIAYVGMWASDGSFLDSVAYSAVVSAGGTVDITLHWTYQQAVVA